ncbi:efflux RND transporter permease subunit [Planctomicrobium sp. SH527]|uniref:efflux RND transporter permease subunit n=1 Tax=Planctomicrobium sp. SH527 TaxID=3448123 RepID=UPI003F5C8D12
MDDIARLPIADRTDLFTETARQRGLTPAIIEKDFWVCWTLKRLYAMFRLFMLVGIVKKNGVLQIDKTNELRSTGMDRDAAIIEANHTWLRPILMTTVMLIAAMVPIAIEKGQERVLAPAWPRSSSADRFSVVMAGIVFAESRLLR